MATLTNLYVEQSSNPVPCVKILTSTTPVYIKWSDLSNYDKDIVDAAEDEFGAPLSYSDLMTCILPNGMPFTSVYKYIMKRYDSHTTEFTLSDNPAVVEVSCNHQKHQISVQGNGGVTGTLALTAIPFGKTEAETVNDEAGNPVVFDLAAEQTLILDGVYSAFEFAPTDVSGNYTITVLGLKSGVV